MKNPRIQIFENDVLNSYLGTKNFDLIIADIPYPTIKKGWTGDQLEKLFLIVSRQLTLNGAFILFGNPSDVFIYQTAWLAAGFNIPLVNHLTWNRTPSTKPTTGKWKNYTEHILIFSHKSTFKNKPRHWSESVLPLQYRRDSDKHAHVKPRGMIELFLHLYTTPGDLVLDMCSGSGTVPLQCAEMNRDCIAFETNPDAAVFDLQQFEIKRLNP